MKKKRNIKRELFFTGNILRQPVLMKKECFKKHPKASINANNIKKNGILIGCHHGLSENDINLLKLI